MNMNAGVNLKAISGIKPKAQGGKNKSRSPAGTMDVIKSRQSQEIIIAVAGAVGSGTDTIVELAKEMLGDHGYDVETVKLSEYINACLEDKKINVDVGDVSTKDPKFFRYRRLQEGGNVLRTVVEDNVLAQYAITKIASIRAARNSGVQPPNAAAATVKTAYLIDQLKHPAEVDLLRAVYSNAFYMIGVVSTQANREHRLQASDGVKPNNISDLIENDRKQSTSHGQQLEKTLYLSDFFVSTDCPQREALRTNLDRFFRLAHGDNTITPTQHEFGMYIAYSSGLRSACMSRQVGAAILGDEGNIIATGRNDVPAPGGGLYGPQHGKNDARCANWGGGQCHNHSQKDKIRGEFKQVASNLLKELNLSKGQSDFFQAGDDVADRFADQMFSNSRVRDLIEFSRSIHAEMDAITTLARNGGPAAKGAVLYTTTFPCHNCARHIVAAGITSVYYIEPYEKSLAITLHGDAITTNSPGKLNVDEIGKVRFIHFEGISPSLYQELFELVEDRKSTDGRLIRKKMSASNLKIVEYLADYTQFEDKVAQLWDESAKKLMAVDSQ